MTPIAWLFLALAVALTGGPRPHLAGPGGSRSGRRRGSRAGRSGRSAQCGRPGGAGAAALPLVLDLAAAALRAGRPLPDALALAAPAAGDADRAGDAGDAGGHDAADEPADPDDQVSVTLRRVAGLLRLGAEPQQAWGSVPDGDPLGPVVPVAVRSATSGIRLAGAFERLAADLRAERAARAAARAQRAGIFAMAPLAACFLPSFVCLGVIPVVAGLAARALGAAP